MFKSASIKSLKVYIQSVLIPVYIDVGQDCILMKLLLSLRLLVFGCHLVPGEHIAETLDGGREDRRRCVTKLNTAKQFSLGLHPSFAPYGRARNSWRYQNIILCYTTSSNYNPATHNVTHSPCTSTCTTHPALPSPLPSTTLLCTQLTNTHLFHSENFFATCSYY